MIPPRVRLAVYLAFISHGLFILTARYRSSYDAYTHMLFATHYASGWFSLWEPRWYTGFPVVSYPPLAHQLVALLIPAVGFDRAFAIILWIVTALYPLGVYTFSRVFIGKTGASYAALAAAFLLPIYVSAYVFGQLPFLLSTLFSLFGAAALAHYLREGKNIKSCTGCFPHFDSYGRGSCNVISSAFFYPGSFNTFPQYPGKACTLGKARFLHAVGSFRRFDCRLAVLAMGCTSDHANSY